MACYTANYQLHQWEPADFFLRTDFYADFAKLDAALAGKAGLADLAEKLGIPVQDAVRAAGSTNGAAIHLTGRGVPVIVIGVPVRYAHTHYGVSAYADFDNAVKLACEILKRADADLIESF